MVLYAWCHVVWYCMAWHGMALFVIVWSSMVWYGMVCVVWYDIEPRAMIWYGMVLHGMAWCGMVWSGLVWHGCMAYGIRHMVYGIRHVMVWYGIVPYAWYMLYGIL